MNSKITPEACRKLRGDLTQSEVAKLWHTNIRTVQRWESGEIVPSYLTFEGMKAIKKGK
jgi:DNA-binding transcriptional regulator YiaG